MTLVPRLTHTVTSSKIIKNGCRAILSASLQEVTTSVLRSVRVFDIPFNFPESCGFGCVDETVEISENSR